jgi:CheY-like chemotaxis protein
MRDVSANSVLLVDDDPTIRYILSNNWKKRVSKHNKLRTESTVW